MDEVVAESKGVGRTKNRGGTRVRIDVKRTLLKRSVGGRIEMG
jgi:hypothetical protein